MSRVDLALVACRARLSSYVSAGHSRFDVRRRSPMTATVRACLRTFCVHASQEVDMGWVIERPAADGSLRYTAMNRDPFGRTRSAGTTGSERGALGAALGQDDNTLSGQWRVPAAGRVTCKEYAEEIWLPSRHLEVTTHAGYASYLRNHFVPFFGHMPLARIMPSTVQEWVNQAARNGLAPRSIAKYHVMLHSVFVRAVRDRLIAFNPCEDTELPKVVTKKTRTLTPEEYSSVVAEISPRSRPW